MNFKYWYVLCKHLPNFLKGHSLSFANSHIFPVLWQCSISNQFSSDSEVEDEFQYDIKSLSVDIKTVAGEDLGKIKAVQSLAMEMDLMQQMGCRYIPQKLTVSQWHELLGIKCRKDRQNFYKMVYTEEIEKARTFFSFDHSSVEVNYSESLFPEISNHQIEKFYNYKLSLAEIFGPHLLIDCSEESCVKPHEVSSCAMELSRMWLLNRRNANPFNIIFCNIDRNNSILQEKLIERLSGTDDFISFLNFTEKSYLHLFPVSKLVYLTPFSKNELGKFSSNCIYIMGAFLDRSPETSSLAVAKRLGIRTATFPIEKFSKLKENVEILSLDQCVAILNDVKNGASWQYAFRHIPREKLQTVDEEFMGKKQSNHKSAIDVRFRWKANYSNRPKYLKTPCK